jgi:hypothetical protein
MKPFVYSADTRRVFADPTTSRDLHIAPGGTCQDIIDLLDQGLSEQCGALQATAGVYCGCEANGADSTDYPLRFREDACRICPNRELLPDPSIPIETVFSTNGVL